MEIRRVQEVEFQEAYLSTLRDRMEHASIEMLKQSGRVGVVNACLRIKNVYRWKCKIYAGK